MMKVKVDFDLCESNAICMGIVPEVFELRDDNFLYLLDEVHIAELPLVPEIGEVVLGASPPLELAGPRTLVVLRSGVRGDEPHPIMPRLMQTAGPGPTLLLPWDPDYTEHGTGDATVITGTSTASQM